MTEINQDNEIQTVKIREILPPELHDKVSSKSLDIEVPLEPFKKTKVEISEEIHLFNSNKSHELIFNPYEDEPEVILVHKIYVDGPGVASGTFIEYHENGNIAYGRFLNE